MDQSFHTVQECNSLLERCKKDVEALKDERSMLMSRIQVIDTDLNEVGYKLCHVQVLASHPLTNGSTATITRLSLITHAMAIVCPTQVSPPVEKVCL